METFNSETQVRRAVTFHQLNESHDYIILSSPLVHVCSLSDLGPNAAAIIVVSLMSSTSFTVTILSPLYCLYIYSFSSAVNFKVLRVAPALLRYM